MPVTVAFIGLGNMGGRWSPIWSRPGTGSWATISARPRARQPGRAGRRSPAAVGEAVGEAEVAITMLPAGKHVAVCVGGGRAGGPARDPAHRLLHHRSRQRPRGACPGGRARMPVPRRAGVRRRRRRGRRRRSPSWSAAAERPSPRPSRSSGSWASASSMRRVRRWPGGQDLQQHDPRHLHDRRRRGLRAGREARPRRTRRCSTSPRPRPASAGR